MQLEEPTCQVENTKPGMQRLEQGKKLDKSKQQDSHGPEIVQPGKMTKPLLQQKENSSSGEQQRQE